MKIKELNITDLKINNPIPWIISFLFFLFLAFRNVIPELPNDFYLNQFIQNFYSNLKLNQFINQNFISTLIKLLASVMFASLPIIGITFIEFFKNNGDIRSRFALTSLGKIRHAEGFKASEIWFFFFTKILNKVPFFITLASLGLSKFSEPFYNSLISIYKY